MFYFDSSSRNFHNYNYNEQMLTCEWTSQSLGFEASSGSSIVHTTEILFSLLANVISYIIHGFNEISRVISAKIQSPKLHKLNELSSDASLTE